MVAQEAGGGRLSGVTAEGQLEVDSSPPHLTVSREDLLNICSVHGWQDWLI